MRFLFIVLSLCSFACRGVHRAAALSAAEENAKRAYYLAIDESKVRVVEQKPQGEIRGDVLFLHGFADQLSLKRGGPRA